MIASERACSGFLMEASGRGDPGAAAGVVSCNAVKLDGGILQEYLHNTQAEYALNSISVVS